MKIFGFQVSVKRSPIEDADLAPLNLADLTLMVSELQKVVQRMERKVYRDEAKESENEALKQVLPDDSLASLYPGMATKGYNL